MKGGPEDAAFDSSVRATAERLLRYLERNPVAQDTEYGVAAWWLSGAVRVDGAVVRAALQLLEEEGQVQRRVRFDGAVIYERRARAG